MKKVPDFFLTHSVYKSTFYLITYFIFCTVL